MSEDQIQGVIVVAGGRDRVNNHIVVITTTAESGGQPDYSNPDTLRVFESGPSGPRGSETIVMVERDVASSSLAQDYYLNYFFLDENGAPDLSSMHVADLASATGQTASQLNDLMDVFFW